jgi:hypothetical protein
MSKSDTNPQNNQSVHVVVQASGSQTIVVHNPGVSVDSLAAGGKQVTPSLLHKNPAQFQPGEANMEGVVREVSSWFYRCRVLIPPSPP